MGSPCVGTRRAPLTLSPRICPWDASLVPSAPGGLASSLVDGTGYAGYHTSSEGSDAPAPPLGQRAKFLFLFVTPSLYLVPLASF